MFYAKLIATGLYSGLIPKMPGTAGSLAALFVWYILHAAFGINSAWLDLALGLLVTALGLHGTALYLKAIQAPRGLDPPCIVADEWAGMFIALIAVCPHSPGLMLAAFAFFRLFDITKPALIGRAESLPGAWGIMADDVLAGACALVCVQLIALTKYGT
jgi:phosphatidylglycerophosphatase A